MTSEVSPFKTKLTSYFRTRTCKVPQLTWQFWVIKTGATTVGETVSDYFNVDLGLGLGGAASVFYPLLFGILVLQFFLPRYVPYVYWLGVILMSICGTIFTDGLHDNLGMALWIENIIFFILMTFCFAVWYYVEGTLDFHSINTVRREGFYWLTILFTFSLGTAIGDGISEATMLGYGPTFGLFVGTIIMSGCMWYFKIVDTVTGFWLCYIMTRPLGAALGDLMSVQGPDLYTHITPINSTSPVYQDLSNIPSFQPTSRPTMLFQQGGGANLGYGYTSLIFIVIIIVLTTWMTYTGLDQLPLSQLEGEADNIKEVELGKEEVSVLGYVMIEAVSFFSSTTKLVSNKSCLGCCAVLTCCKICSVFSLLGFLFLLTISSLLLHQPLYVKGIKDPVKSSKGCSDGATIYAICLIVSAAFCIVDHMGKRAEKVTNDQRKVYEPLETNEKE